jgi:hypothetical protein
VKRKEKCMYVYMFTHSSDKRLSCNIIKNHLDILDIDVTAIYSSSLMSAHDTLDYTAESISGLFHLFHTLGSHRNHCTITRKLVREKSS